MPDFRFRLPSINDLTDLQQVAFYEQRPVLVTGGPGSGKTVVTIFRFLRQITANQNAVFFTFNRTLMSSIRGTLRQQADVRLPNFKPAEVERIIDNKIVSMFDWYGSNFHAGLSNESDAEILLNFTNYVSGKLQNRRYDEMFIDESQDLRSGILSASHTIAEKVSCGADRSQDFQGHYIGPSDDMIYEILNNGIYTVRQGLTSNFRNTKEIFEFARQFVPEDDTVQEIDTTEFPKGEKPEVIGNLNDEAQLNLILEIIQQNSNSNIGILVHTRKEILIIKEFLIANNYSCSQDAKDNASFSYYFNGMPLEDRETVESRLKSPFILSFESCKGLEFDIVVMAYFEDANWALTKYKPNNETPDLDAKGNPKFWATVNHYYVAATRARNLLYVLYNTKPKILNFWEEDQGSGIFDDNDLPF